MVRLSSSVSGLRRLLRICERYEATHVLKYNASKNVIYMSKAGIKESSFPPIKLSGQALQNLYKYLGNILKIDLGDDDLEREKRVLAALCGNTPARRFVHSNKKSKRVCVIGAGVAGLSSARYLKEEGINFTVFEATAYVGGTWRYDPRIGTDENGLPLHTSMYKYLRTNLPKPTMELRGFPLPENLPSFPKWEDYYKYLKAYAKHYDVFKYIQFLHNVLKVRRENNVWKVKHEHVKTKDVFEEEFDYIIVGNGHFSVPRMPNITGEKLFNGTIIHSHDYRVPDPYKNRRVLVIGAGPSGMDIGLQVAEVSRSLIHSHHSRVEFKTPFPKHYKRKPDVKEFNETGAIFIDGTFEEVDDVIYCTGFNYDYPFLDETSGLTIRATSVVPLYKYMVNINQPTMLLMGLVVRACLVVALDAQARYATALIKGNFTIPSKAEMMAEFDKRANAIRSKGLPMSLIHALAEKEDEYYEQLSNESGIDRVPPVMFKIRASDTVAKLDNFYTYRNYEYTVIDDHTFVRKLEDIKRRLDP